MTWDWFRRGTATMVRQLSSATRPETPPASPPLLFMHIPKTAGTSLVHLLASRFPAKACWYRAERPLCAAWDVNNFQYVSGHVGFDWVAKFREPPVVVTFLRNPLDRALSAYSFVRSHRPEQLRAGFLRDGEDPGSPSLARRVQDVERVRQLSLGELLRDEPQIANSIMGNKQTRILGGTFDRDSEEQVERAIDNLSRCHVVGLTERFADSVAILCQTLGWAPFAELPRHNVTSNRLPVEQLDDQTREALAAMLAPDIALYAAAIRIFEDRFRHAGGASMNAPVPPQPLPSAINFDFSGPFVGAGWHQREQFGDAWACWTGPGKESWLDLSLTEKARPRRFRCELLHGLRPEVLASLRLRINDHDVAVRPSERKGQVTLLADVPTHVTAWRPSQVRVSFHIDRTWRPSEVDPESTDDRRLGICVRRLSMR